MTAVTFNESVSVTLDGAGNGTVKIGPKGHATTWSPEVASVRCTTNVLEASCRIYVGPDTSQRFFREGTLSGSTGDSTGRVTGDIRMNTFIWAVWAGGDPGASATLTVTGTAEIP
jgi:hypothetical protein